MDSAASHRVCAGHLDAVDCVRRDLDAKVLAHRSGLWGWRCAVAEAANSKQLSAAAPPQETSTTSPLTAGGGGTVRTILWNSKTLQTFWKGQFKLTWLLTFQVHNFCSHSRTNSRRNEILNARRPSPRQNLSCPPSRDNVKDACFFTFSFFLSPHIQKTTVSRQNFSLSLDKFGHVVSAIITFQQVITQEAKEACRAPRQS